MTDHAERCAVCRGEYPPGTCQVWRTLNGRPYGRHGLSPFVFVCPDTQYPHGGTPCIERARAFVGLIFHTDPGFYLPDDLEPEDATIIYAYLTNPWAAEAERLARETVEEMDWIEEETAEGGLPLC